jgi:hypothetical protein
MEAKEARVGYLNFWCIASRRRNLRILQTKAYEVMMEETSIANLGREPLATMGDAMARLR